MLARQDDRIYRDVEKEMHGREIISVRWQKSEAAWHAGGNGKGRVI